MKIFKKIYSSESISDVYRDIDEFLDPVFNKSLLNIINENTIFELIFKYKNNKDNVNLLLKKYNKQNISDIEKDIDFILNDFNFTYNQFGFFDGDLTIKIMIN